MLSINACFDAGNIEVVDAADPQNIQLRIRPDSRADFLQWFYFRVSATKHTALQMQIINAGDAAYIGGWEGYQALASYDLEEWFRIPTFYAHGKLTLIFEPEMDATYFAYFQPYSLARHQQLVAEAQCAECCELIVAGTSPQGRSLDVLKFGESAAGKKTIWITARQHPGETMAEWFAEGLIERLLDSDDAIAAALLQLAVVYVVPNMNPDGSALGNLRSNARGVNLNRVWQDPDADSSAEVFHIRNSMQQSGCDLYFDIHGDETLPWNFIAGQEGLNASAKILKQERQLRQWLLEANPDFQIKEGYQPAQFGEDSLKLASNWVGDHFDIPAVTLEMPFKDNKTRPDPRYGWSAERSKQLGAALLHPLYRHCRQFSNPV